MAIKSCSSRHLPPPISKLGDDLLVQILVRVPEPRSAFRCKSVCKLWNSLISDPYFNRRFVCQHQSRTSTSCDGEPDLLPFNDPQSILSFIPVPDELKRRFVVMDCFKDLLLCGFEHEWGGSSEPGRLYIVCNPFTKQWIALPLARDLHKEALLVKGKVVARLVCQPVVSCHVNRDANGGGGGGGEEIIYSEYRFRVVCLYDTYDAGDTRIDLFCSESGEWKKEALVLKKSSKRYDDGISLDGNLYWANSWREIVRWDPFQLDTTPPTDFSASPPLLRGNVRYSSFSASQGALHIVQFEEEGNALGVWTLENCRPRPKWRRLYQVSLKTLMANYKLQRFWLDAVLGLHPGKPEVVFLRFRKPDCPMYSIFSCNLSKGELEEEPELCSYRHSPYWKLFQPSFFCWPTPIPRYEELRCSYGGGYACFVQDNGVGAEEEWQQRKNKRVKITADQVPSEEAYGRGRTNRSKSQLKLTVNKDTILVQSRKRRKHELVLGICSREHVSEI